MACDCEGPESTKVATVFECDETEWNDDEEDGLLVNVPAKKEGGVGAECGGADEYLPGRVEEKFDQWKCLEG